MKYIKLIIFVFSLNIFASGEDHHEHGHGGEKAGKDKAITQIDEHLGLKLSPQATARLKIKTITFSGNLDDIAKSSYVVIGKERALYRKRNGFYKLINEEDFSTAFMPSDEIVTEGIELLRISDIFSTDKSEYGHAH